MEDDERIPLDLPSRWMNQAGTLGFLPSASLPHPEGIFVTNPVSPRPRTPSTERRLIPFPGSFLLHTGLPNPGWSAVRRLYASRRNSTASAIWLHVIGADVAELTALVRDCEELEDIAAIELGLPPGCTEDEMLRLINAARGEIPLVVHISAGEDLCLLKTLPYAVSAVTLGSPRGSLPVRGGLVHGRLHGPGLFPVMLEALQKIQGLPVPIILGGICRIEDGITALHCGAAAVQMDCLCWSGDWPANT